MAGGALHLYWDSKSVPTQRDQMQSHAFCKPISLLAKLMHNTYSSYHTTSTIHVNLCDGTGGRGTIFWPLNTARWVHAQKKLLHCNTVLTLALVGKWNKAFYIWDIHLVETCIDNMIPRACFIMERQISSNLRRVWSSKLSIGRF